MSLPLKPCICGGNAKTHCERVAEDAEECWVACERCGRPTDRIEDAYCDFDTAEWLWEKGKAKPAACTVRTGRTGATWRALDWSSANIGAAMSSWMRTKVKVREARILLVNRLPQIKKTGVPKKLKPKCIW